MAATSCADIGSDVKLGFHAVPACADPGSRIVWRSFDYSTSSMAMRYLVPSSDATRARRFPLR
jgi:hypothetical protein